MVERYGIEVRCEKGAVWAEFEGLENGFRLLRVSPLEGDMPEVSHLLGEFFPDHDALHRALVSAMRGPVGDTLDNVRLSVRAYQAWMDLVAAAARRLVESGVMLDISDIPNEMAAEQPDGRLRIWVDVQGVGTIEMFVPREDWSWTTRPS